MSSARRALLLLALAACARQDPEAAARAAAMAAANPGVAVLDPSLPVGVVIVDLVTAVEPLAVDAPATITIGAARSGWGPEAPARFEGVTSGGRSSIEVAGPYLVEPAYFSPSTSHGARIAVKVLPYGPLPPPEPIYAERGPSAPEKVLELDLTEGDTINVRWMMGLTTIDMSELPRASPDLVGTFRRAWELHGGHREPADRESDRAVIRAAPTASIASIAPVLGALLGVRRERAARPGIQTPVFAVAIAPPEPKQKVILDDEIGPLDVVARAPDHDAAIAGAAPPMRDALSKCRAAACSSATRARLLLHLGEALSAAGKRDEAELAFFDARVVDPSVALDALATPESARIFDAARKRRVPTIKAGALSVSGRLAPDVIETGIQARAGLVRLCFVEGLRRNPDLRGRIAVRFVIGNDGRVALVSNGGSDLPDAPTQACVIETFLGLAFLRPEAGVVTVIYPLAFSPKGG